MLCTGRARACRPRRPRTRLPPPQTLHSPLPRRLTHAWSSPRPPLFRHPCLPRLHLGRQQPPTHARTSTCAHNCRSLPAAACAACGRVCCTPLPVLATCRGNPASLPAGDEVKTLTLAVRQLEIAVAARSPRLTPEQTARVKDSMFLVFCKSLAPALAAPCVAGSTLASGSSSQVIAGLWRWHTASSGVATSQPRTTHLACLVLCSRSRPRA